MTNDAVDAARAILPTWATWRPLLTTALAVALAAMLASLSVLWIELGLIRRNSVSSSNWPGA